MPLKLKQLYMNVQVLVFCSRCYLSVYSDKNRQFMKTSLSCLPPYSTSHYMSLAIVWSLAVNIVYSYNSIHATAWYCCNIVRFMTSSYGNVFHFTGSLWGNPLVAGRSPSQRPVMQSFDVYFDLHLNKQFSKQLRSWWFETPSCSSQCYCNVFKILMTDNL